ncbi:serine hydrolase domain-containing protein [Thalassotalea eurytherma]|uniref:Beta-lactamase-related domain-containing protein n=1 Tax=Thalassotalea eurytherma TaxID=1144278 RepID=A0ABQ6H3T8_9GAMM|nr:serine hydrolase domain-containing protein [Thalassotalea eurytherma]GLX82174.1 hypothetical protein theurythT_16260 [Thalassotalea eurytherma]
MTDHGNLTLPLISLASLFLGFIIMASAMSTAYGQPLAAFNHEFSKYVEELLNEKSIPGASYVIVKNNDIVAIETFGHTAKNSKQAVTPTTVFRLASVSKPFAATLTAQLAQEGKVNINAPITHFVPEFSLKQADAAQQIKVHHVLSHSSGLLPNTYDNLLHENWSMHKIIGRFDRLSPICQPEKCYGYQNILYGFLQDVIEASQPKDYESLLAERVFKPLNMAQASVGQAAFLAEYNRAKPHVLMQRKPIGPRKSNGKHKMRYTWKQVKVNDDFYKVPAAAGVNASITDMAQWLRANMGYVPHVLSPELLARVTTPYIRTKKDLRRRYWRNFVTDAHYGYGWRIYQVNDHELVYHGGWVQGFRADIGYAPKLNIGFAILMNAESNAISEISANFWQKVFEQADAYSTNVPINATP